MENIEFSYLDKPEECQIGMLKGNQKSQQPRILFVGAFPPAERNVFGGNVTACKALLNSSLPKRAELVLLDSTQISNPPPGLPLRLLLAVRRFFTYLIQFEKRQPDIVLLFTSVGASMVEKGAMAWYARLRGTPALVFPRGGAVIDACQRSRVTRTWVRIALGGARKILCQGPAWQRFAVNVLRLSVEDAPIITNWTATPALLSIGQQRSGKSENKPVRLLFLGWLEESKGIFELIEACHHLSPSRQFVLDIVGEGNTSVAARELVKKYGLEKIVHFRGWLKEVDIENALAEADIFVLPSWAEGLPNAMVEAMAAKLAVVVSSVGNIPDVVTDGCEALLVPPKDVTALQIALAKVLDDTVLRHRLAEAAFSLAENQWGVERAVDNLLSVVRSSI